MPEPLHNPQCRANHLNLWAIEPRYLSQSVAAIKAGLWPARVRAEEPAIPEAPKAPPRFFNLTSDGVAVIEIRGAMMKGFSKYADVDSIAVRRAVREAVADERAKVILLVIDSPGGSCAGTQELADDVAAADEKKPVHAFIEDLGASAAYWVASQARRITVNQAGEVGSIGTVAVVEDTSEAATMAGVKVHVISTGAYKGAFADGAPVLPEHLAYLRQRVDEANERFLSAVEAGRDLKGKDLEAVSDGRVFASAEAKRLGLVDRVASLDETMQGIRDDLERSAEAKKRAARMRTRATASESGA